MLALLTPTAWIGCDRPGCGLPALHVAVNAPDQGFVSRLCVVHLASFLLDYQDNPVAACERLEFKRLVKPDQ